MVSKDGVLFNVGNTVDTGVAYGIYIGRDPRLSPR